MPELDLFLRLADIAVSLAILVAILVMFAKGDLISRRSLAEVISYTVREVLKELREQ